MAKLTIQKHEGGVDFMYTAFDDGIDWDASSCSLAQLRADYDSHVDGLVWLPDARPVKLYFSYPSRKVLAYALRESGANLSEQVALAKAVNEGETVEEAIGDNERVLTDVLEAAAEIGRFVLDRVENLDGYPDAGKTGTHDRYAGRTWRHRDLLPEELFEDLGQLVLMRSGARAETKKRSGSRRGGTSNGSVDNTQTTAPSVDGTRPPADGGGVPTGDPTGPGSTGPDQSSTQWDTSEGTS